MSSRAFIGIEDPGTGRVRGIYCHYDGDLEGVGAVLRKHYLDLKKIEELISLGPISCLRENIGEKHDFLDLQEAENKSWTTSYYRDRGEDAVIDEYESLYDIPQGGLYTFAYVYTKHGLWLYKELHEAGCWLPFD